MSMSPVAIRHPIQHTVLCGILTVLMLGAPAFASATTPVQFIDGIWLREETVTTAEPTRVYVALRNNATAEITAAVTLYADDDVIETRSVSALPGRLIETWGDWTPTQPGSVTLTATLHDITVHHQDAPQSSDETVQIDPVTVTVAEPPPPPRPATSSPNATSAQNATGTAGLERLTPNNRAGTWLRRLTERFTTTADQLTDYESTLEARYHRNTASSSQGATTSPTGARSATNTNTPATSSNVATMGTTTVGATLWEPIKRWFVRNAQNAWLGTITALRWLFQHPALVQIILLVSLLWFTYRVARHFGKR